MAATHPHLVNPGELVTGVTLKEFQQRRSRLMLGIQKYAADHLSSEGRSTRNHLVRTCFVAFQNIEIYFT